MVAKRSGGHTTIENDTAALHRDRGRNVSDPDPALQEPSAEAGDHNVGSGQARAGPSHALDCGRDPPRGAYVQRLQHEKDPGPNDGGRRGQSHGSGPHGQAHARSLSHG